MDALRPSLSIDCAPKGGIYAQRGACSWSGFFRATAEIRGGLDLWTLGEISGVIPGRSGTCLTGSAPVETAA